MIYLLRYSKQIFPTELFKSAFLKYVHFWAENQWQIVLNSIQHMVNKLLCCINHLLLAWKRENLRRNLSSFSTVQYLLNRWEFLKSCGNDFHVCDFRKEIFHGVLFSYCYVWGFFSVYAKLRKNKNILLFYIEKAFIIP